MAGEAETSPPVTGRFIGAYSLAQIGAFIGFVPLLNVLLPLRATEVAAGLEATALSQAAMWGAIAAGATNFVIGGLSDRTRTPIGRRRPWILAGLFATALSYVGVFFAETSLQLILAIIAFQIAFNVLFGPFVAVFADRVPDRQKGLVAAFLGLAYPTANLFAALAVAIYLTDPAERFIGVIAAMMVLVLPFALFVLREPPPKATPEPADGRLLVAFRHAPFSLTFASRLFVHTAITLNALYLLYFLQKETDIALRLPDTRPEAVLGWLIVASTVSALAAGFVAGLWSDRAGWRNRFVAAGALMIAAGAAALAFLPDWPGPLVGQILFGLGLGAFTTTESALAAEVLPIRLRAGRDLGIMNIAITGPQIIAPLMCLALVGALGASYGLLFLSSAACAVIGAGLVLAIRRDRQAT